MKFGDVVIFTEAGKEYTATVLQAREIDDHVGTTGEPLLDLGFFKQVIGKDASGKEVIVPVVGTGRNAELAQFRHDVAHESHEFSDRAKLKYGKSYPGGRWKEVPSPTSFTGTQIVQDGGKQVQ